MVRNVLLVASLASFISCKDKSVDDSLSKRCARALSKVGMDEFIASQGKPGLQEQLVIAGVRKQSQAACEAEGLTEEQAACFDSIVDVETLFLSADCPAIAAKQPSWLRMPPPEERKRLLDNMNRERDEATGDKGE